MVRNFFHLDAFTEEISSIFKIYIFISISQAFLLSISTTFYILFLIDTIDFSGASIITSVMFLSQMLLDYPSGSLGDKIGQKWVLSIAYGSYTIVFAMLFLVETFELLIIMAFLFGIGNAQASGALQSWLDNQYGDRDPTFDQDTKLYGFTSARVQTSVRFVSGVAFFIGGLLSTILSRRLTFLIQSIAFIVLTLITVFLLKGKPSQTSEEIDAEQNVTSNHESQLVAGVKFLFSSKCVFFFLMGYAFWEITTLLWRAIILIPNLNGYAGTDDIVGTLRSINYFIATFFSIYIAKLSLSLDTNKLPRIQLLHSLVFFPVLIFTAYFIPLNNEVNLLGILIIFTIYGAFTGIVFNLVNLLILRELVQLVPSNIRNSVYSLVPTISSIFLVFILPFVGWSIEFTDNLITGMIIGFLLALVGVVFTTLGFKFRNPTITT